ncbi:MAG: hypothetical protein Kow0074_02080 [Candidatus Zixiibacteriota bacterium]
MRRVCALVVVVACCMFAMKSADAMRKPGSLPGVGGPTNQLSKITPRQPLTAAQQATIKRRIIAAREGLKRIHITGSANTTIPTKALDAFAEWRDNGAEDVEIWYDPVWGTPHFIKGEDLSLGAARHLGKRNPGGQAEAAYATFGHLPEFLGLRAPSEELRIVRSETDHLGMTHLRLQQTYKGHDVWARDLYVHYTKDGKMNVINGRWVPTPTALDDVEPVLTEQDAIAAVKRHFSDYDSVATSDAELVVYVDQEQTPWWAWKVRTSLTPIEGYDVFIDAVTGEYLHRVSFVYTDGPVVGSGVDLFGETRTVHAYEVGGTYYMIDASKPMFNQAASILPAFPVGAIPIQDNRGLPLPISYYVTSPNVNQWNNSAAVSAGYHVGIVYDYYYQTHGRNSFNDSGSTIPVIINHAMGDNATWANGIIRLGIGGTITENWAAPLDLIAHEFTHGVVEYTAGLVYEAQSGALNESFADIFGCMVEFYLEGANGDWLIGEDVALPPVCGTLRDMEHPEFGCPDAQPSSMAQYVNLPVTREGDWGGVHINSGIPNRAFFLIADAIGLSKAESIYYYTLTSGKLVAMSQFADLRTGVLESANELYPTQGDIINAIGSAFDAVGITVSGGYVPPDAEPVPTSAQWIASTDELFGGVIRSDTSGDFLGRISSTNAINKPSVPDSGDIVYFIDESGGIINARADGSAETRIALPGIFFLNIAASPDGRKIAFDVFPDPTIYVLDLTAPQDSNVASWPLYTPTYTDSVIASDVYFPDVLEWDIYGETIIYDCWNRLPRETDTLYYWDILSLDVETGTIQRALPGIPAGVTIGNPTVAKTRPNILAFDANLPGGFTVMGANRLTNDIGVITLTFSDWGRPSFAPNIGRSSITMRGIYGKSTWTRHQSRQIQRAQTMNLFILQISPIGASKAATSPPTSPSSTTNLSCRRRTPCIRTTPTPSTPPRSSPSRPRTGGMRRWISSMSSDSGYRRGRRPMCRRASIRSRGMAGMTTEIRCPVVCTSTV